MPKIYKTSKETLEEDIGDFDALVQEDENPLEKTAEKTPHEFSGDAYFVSSSSKKQEKKRSTPAKKVDFDLDEVIELFNSKQQKKLVKEFVMQMLDLPEHHLKGKDLHKVHEDAFTKHPNDVYKAHGFVPPTYDVLKRHHDEIKDDPKYKSLEPLVKYTASLLKNYVEVTGDYKGSVTEKGVQYFGKK